MCIKNNLPVQICISWSLDVQISPANVVNSLVVDHKGAVGVFQSCVSR